MDTVCKTSNRKISSRIRMSQSTSNKKLQDSSNNNKTVNMFFKKPFQSLGSSPPSQSILYMSYILVFIILTFASQFNQVNSSSAASRLDFIAIGQSLDVGQVGSSQQHSMALSAANFDATLYRNIREAIRNHPDLREVSLPVCECGALPQCLKYLPEWKSAFCNHVGELRACSSCSFSCSCS